MPRQPASMSPAAIALNQFRLGAHPGDAAATDPRRALVDHFDLYDARPGRYAELADAGEIVRRYRDQRQATRRMNERLLSARSKEPWMSSSGSCPPSRSPFFEITSHSRYYVYAVQFWERAIGNRF